MQPVILLPRPRPSPLRRKAVVHFPGLFARGVPEADYIEGLAVSAGSMTTCSGRKCAVPIAALSNRVGLTRCARCIRASGSTLLEIFPECVCPRRRAAHRSPAAEPYGCGPPHCDRRRPATCAAATLAGANRQNVAGVFLRLEFRIAAITVPKGGWISRVSIARIPRSGLVQQRLFKAALDELAVIGEPVNRVLEVDLDADEVTLTLYDLPAG